MSAEEDDGPGQRETAYRLFAAEFEDADFSYAESDEERAPNYVVTPTGARVNRLFAVGVLTEVEPVGEDVLRARVVDPTGAFVIYAGQYQPDAQAFFERAEPPAFVAVTGKARTFQPEDSDVIYTSVRPESVNEVDAETRDRWTVGTAERTLDRVGVAAAALDSDARGDELAELLRSAGVEDALAAGLPLAIDHYDTTGAYLTALRDLSLDAARVVAGERDEVKPLTLGPADGDEGDLAALVSVDLEEPSEESVEPLSATTDATGTDTRAGSASAESGGPADPGKVEQESASEGTPSAVEIAEESNGGASGEAATGDEVSASDVDHAPTTSADTTTTGSTDSGSETTTDAAVEESSTPTAPEEGTGADDAADDDEGIGDFESGEFDLDDDVREEVESEYGTEFQSGSEVDDPGEADIETPDAEGETATESADEEPEPSAPGEPGAGADSEPDVEAGVESATESESGSPAAVGSEANGDADDSAATEEDVDPEDAVMDAMEALDEGDGADRQAVIDRAVERTGEDEASVEDAIQSALMDGRCYEPDDETLKPI